MFFLSNKIILVGLCEAMLAEVLHSNINVQTALTSQTAIISLTCHITTWGGQILSCSVLGDTSVLWEFSDPPLAVPPLQTPRRQKRLFCRYYDGNRNPRYILGPVKQEDEWDKPRIVRFLDIISDEEIETVKELAKPRVNALHFLAFGILNSMLVWCECAWLSPLEHRGAHTLLASPCSSW